MILVCISKHLILAFVIQFNILLVSQLFFDTENIAALGLEMSKKLRNSYLMYKCPSSNLKKSNHIKKFYHTVEGKFIIFSCHQGYIY